MMLKQLQERLKPSLTYFKNNAFAYYWGVALLLLPVYLRVHSNNPQVALIEFSLSKNLLYISLITVSLILFGIRKYNKAILISTTIIAVISFLNMYFQASSEVYYQFTLVSFSLLLVNQMASNFREKDINIMLNFMVVMALIQTAWLVANYCGYDPSDLWLMFKGGYQKFKIVNKKMVLIKGADPYQEIVGSLSNANLSGAILAVSLPAFFRDKWNKLIPLPLAGIYLTSSTIPALTAIGVFLVWYVHKNLGYKSLPLLAISGVLICLLLYYVGKTYNIDFLTDTGRVAVWKNAITWVKGREILYGKGVGIFADLFHRAFPGYHGTVFFQAHNEYVEAYVCFGLIGILSILGIIIYAWLLNGNPILFACFCGTLIESSGHFAMHVAAGAVLCFVPLALLIAENNSKKSSTQR